jgi:hypothetical protein
VVGVTALLDIARTAAVAERRLTFTNVLPQVADVLSGPSIAAQRGRWRGAIGRPVVGREPAVVAQAPA